MQKKVSQKPLNYTTDNCSVYAHGQIIGYTIHKFYKKQKMCASINKEEHQL